ncbi:hypothetical protein BUE76_23375 [Cnuella takakiae]|nr:hypothetical protein BUE76_23375 [Cnuella takakiae]
MFLKEKTGKKKAEGQVACQRQKGNGINQWEGAGAFIDGASAGDREDECGGVLCRSLFALCSVFGSAGHYLRAAFVRCLLKTGLLFFSLIEKRNLNGASQQKNNRICVACIPKLIYVLLGSP